MVNQPVIFLLLVVVISCLTVGSTSQPDHSVHIVGGVKGWRVPPKKTYYREWAAKRNVVVGDKLMFLYHNSVHDVKQVSRNDYKNCTETKVLREWSQGPTIITMEEPGMHYFFDNMALHCEAGQKLAVNVTEKKLTVSASGARIAISPKYIGLFGLYTYVVYALFL